MRENKTANGGIERYIDGIRLSEKFEATIQGFVESFLFRLDCALNDLLPRLSASISELPSPMEKALTNFRCGTKMRSSMPIFFSTKTNRQPLIAEHAPGARLVTQSGRGLKHLTISRR